MDAIPIFSRESKVRLLALGAPFAEGHGGRMQIRRRSIVAGGGILSLGRSGQRGHDGRMVVGPLASHLRM
jgi:hypothetical protein